MKQFNISIVGCGFICDYYIKTFENYPNVKIAGVWDHVETRRDHVATTFDVPAYPDFESLLADESTCLVVNLTNPRSHYDISKASLLAGKHVYSEKPLAMELEHAEELFALAEDKGLMLGSAPCSVLSAQAQTLMKAVEDGLIGQVYGFTARLHEGLLHQSLSEGESGVSPTGTPWPWKDELEVGCTMEHAGYYLTWLTAIFGPIESVVSQASVCVKDKGTPIALNAQTADFSSAILKFESGLMGTLACSIVMPHDRGLTLVGEKGRLSTDDCWDYAAPVYLQQESKVDEFIAWLSPKIQFLRKLPGGEAIFEPSRHALSSVAKEDFIHFPAGQTMDFARGPVELLEASEEGRASWISADHALHVNEVTLAMQYPEKYGHYYEPKSRFKSFNGLSRRVS